MTIGSILKVDCSSSKGRKRIPAKTLQRFLTAPIQNSIEESFSLKYMKFPANSEVYARI